MTRSRCCRFAISCSIRNTATPELVDYVRRTLDMDLIASGDGKQLYAVQGVRPANIRASQ